MNSLPPNPVVRSLAYSPRIVTAYFSECGLPVPEFEYRFFPGRKWRFDLAWPSNATQMATRALDGNVALEVQGGIWTRGRHNRGAAMLKEWEKMNTAAACGWRILYVQPSELCMASTVELIKKAFGWL